MSCRGKDALTVLRQHYIGPTPTYHKKNIFDFSTICIV